MARKAASQDVERMLRAAVEDPETGALLLQLLYLAQEPDYAQALRRVAALGPAQCRELVAGWPSASPVMRRGSGCTEAIARTPQERRRSA
jgi:hypothetical protein